MFSFGHAHRPISRSVHTWPTKQVFGPYLRRISENESLSLCIYNAYALYSSLRNTLMVTHLATVGDVSEGEADVSKVLEIQNKFKYK